MLIIRGKREYIRKSPVYDMPLTTLLIPILLWPFTCRHFPGKMGLPPNMFQLRVLFILTFVGIMNEVSFNHRAGGQFIFYCYKLHF